MAFRYLIYSTGTAFAETIVRESATNNPGANEASLYSEFVIPEIQPLYLWRVTGGTTVVPNTDANISAYLADIAPAPEPEDDASVGFVTGITTTKIDKVTGAEPNVPIFSADGNIEDSGFAIADLTGATYNFVGSGGTQVIESGTDPKTITIYSTDPTGATVSWGNVVGTISNQTDLWNILTTMTGETANKLDTSIFDTYTGDTATELGNKLESSVFNAYTGTSQPILDAALTGVTNLGTGTVLGGISGRNTTLKSVSVLGGLALSGDANNLIISGETNAAVWGSITGTLSAQTDLWDTLTAMTAATNTKLDEAVFTGYTAATESTITGIENDIQYLSGQTDNKLDISDFNTYSGATDTRISDVEDDVTELYNEGLINVTGATNGLSKATAKVIKLGGALTQDTTISGITHDLTINVGKISLEGTAGIDIIDTDGNDVNVESDGGSIKLVGNTSLGAETTKITISDSQMLITDSRGTKTGLQYNADYSTSFTARSLIDKAYADAIVSGLDLKESVKVATTTGNTDIDLDGGTFGGTIDGYSVQDGDRVLVKNQDSNKEENGIYVYSSGGNNFGRAIDFVNPNVTSGAFTFIETGTANAASGWVLVTQDPINIGTTELAFTKFSEATEYQAGTGIDITGNVISVDGSTLAGNSITWTGSVFDVDVTSGTVATALGTKQDTITGAATTITTANLTANRALVSNGSGKVAVSTITATELGYLVGTTSNIQPQIDSKLSITDFNTFTGTTLGANYYNKTEINAYTGATDTRLDGIDNDVTFLSGVTDTKLDTDIFTGYTASTASMRLFLTHTGGTELNTIAPTAIEWDSVEFSGTSFTWSGGTDIFIRETGDYELSYNLPYNAQGSQSMAIGGNIILNNTNVVDLTAAAGFSTDTNAAGNLALPPVMLSLTDGDKLTLAAFRTGRTGSTESSLTGSILIKKLNTLQ